LKTNPTIVGMARDICISLGKRIRELRKARGWRQIDLAEHAGINENYVSDLEHGRKEVCLRTMQALAQAFDKKTVELLEGIE
jgi:transcriptional regulator with XRE-family HTH domain